MADILIRRLSEDVKTRLKQRAKLHGRSVEAEARAIIEEAVTPAPEPGREPKVGFGTLMQRRFRNSGLTGSEAQLFDEAVEKLRGGSRPRDPGFDS